MGDDSFVYQRTQPGDVCESVSEEQMHGGERLPADCGPDS